MSDDRAVYILNLISARCPELTADDLASVEARFQPEDASIEASSPPEPDLPLEIGEQILDVLSAMTARLDRMAAAVGVSEDDDDAERR